MKPMLPTYYTEAPSSKDWRYEVKYDGFRAILTIDFDTISISSRNEKEMSPLFPEIIDFIKQLGLEDYLPLQLDGELVWLTNQAKADFFQIQWRGRLRKQSLISETANFSPCRFIAFDLLRIKGMDITTKSMEERRGFMLNLGEKLGFPMPPNPTSEALIQLIESFDVLDKALNTVTLLDGEGVVAKETRGTWQEGKRSTNWIKVKNWKTVSCFITALHKENGYVSLAVFKEGAVTKIGSVKNGISAKDKKILYELIKQNASNEDAKFFYIHPSICIEVQFLHVYEENELREPQFSHWLLHTSPTECTWEKFVINQYTFPDTVQITSPDKPLWITDDKQVIKVEYLHYLREVSAFFLPFLKDKLLTTIRYPHGTMDQEKFFQKNKPDYAPAFIKTFMDEDIEYMLCNDIETLLWFGNQLALEFHAPFQKAGKTRPDEIVLDLDPPSIEFFSLAIKAAQEIKKVMDSLRIIAYVKTSGNKGLQIHIPLPEDRFTYQETRIFTDFLGHYLTSSNPDDFTVERLKIKRNNRLYLDFVQHSEGKTIIVPYSPRGNSFAGVATPLFWEEVEENLQLKDFTVDTVPNRIKRDGCPFLDYRHVDNGPAFLDVLSFLKQKKTNL
ncbi:Bifunctional non-homologous end joining protein LigD [Peribacillus sp. Bi96]|uniref:DNA ligase D n=1 Tax=unclassified Peribacillus TaxID=2675266 RepID=UPI001DA7C4D0|nr:DNA ligase D [Peribacillus sp. Bi96]CAH0142822.1 Bifunctional non-homologous end joining protein LigD [Peribacillus sp. Bi96]